MRSPLLNRASHQSIGRYSIERESQQARAARSARQARAIRAADRAVRRRRNADRGNVCKLSNDTTQSAATSSSTAVSANSDTTPRRVRVSAATTTRSTRSATGSLVSTSTGRSPPSGTAANQISPRCTVPPIRPRLPIRPVLGGTPIVCRVERKLIGPEGLRLVSGDIGLSRETRQVSGQCVTEQLGTLDAETFGPPVRLGNVVVVSAEAHHDCHTAKHTPSYAIAARKPQPHADARMLDHHERHDRGDGRSRS